MPKKKVIRLFLFRFFSAAGQTLGAGLFIWLLTAWRHGPYLAVENFSAWLLSITFTLLGMGLWVWSFKVALKDREAGQSRPIHGPYQWLRFPDRAAWLWGFLPGLAIFFRSWLGITAIIIFYLVLRRAAKKSEAEKESNLDKDYEDYQKKTGFFAPRWYFLNKTIFYEVSALLIFGAVFIFLNFSALTLHWINWERSGKITYDKPSKTIPNFIGGLPSENNYSSGQELNFPGRLPNNTSYSSYGTSQNNSYSAEFNQIIISKINVRAPIISASGTSVSSSCWTFS